MAETLLMVAGWVTAAALLLASYRLLRGPEPASRAVSVDALTVMMLPLMLLAAVQAGRGVFVDVALVFAVLSFLSVLALARYLERGL